MSAELCRRPWFSLQTFAVPSRKKLLDTPYCGHPRRYAARRSDKSSRWKRLSTCFYCFLIAQLWHKGVSMQFRCIDPVPPPFFRSLPSTLERGLGGEIKQERSKALGLLVSFISRIAYPIRFFLSLECDR